VLQKSCKCWIKQLVMSCATTFRWHSQCSSGNHDQKNYCFKNRNEDHVDCICLTTKVLCTKNLCTPKVLPMKNFMKTFWRKFKKLKKKLSSSISVKRLVCFLLHDNTPAHTAAIINQFLAKKNGSSTWPHPVFTRLNSSRLFPVSKPFCQHWIISKKCDLDAKEYSWHWLLTCYEKNWSTLQEIV